MVEGVHLSVLLLIAESSSPNNSCSDGLSRSEESLSSSCAILGECTRKYLEAAGADWKGLKRSYCAILTNSQVKKALSKKLRLGLGRWHPVLTARSSHVTPSHSHMMSGQSPPLVTFHDLTIVERIVDALSSCKADWEEVEGEELFMVMANQIHSLIDTAPINSNEYVVLDVSWIAAGVHMSPPSDAIGLFGALLRLKEWHNAYIEIVVPDSSHKVFFRTLNNWRESLGVARVWSASEWKPASGILWRGHINISEQKSFRQTVRSSVSFPGFSLSLSPGVSGSTLTPDILEGVGIQSTYFPSHLELLQPVDVSTLPVFWLSPLQCKLSLADPNPSSVELSRAIFRSHGADKNLGYLFCLCQTSTNPDPDTTTCSQSTAEWVSYILTGDLEHKDPVNHPLWSYETGPVLLVLPDTSDQSGSSSVSCDAWFLWKPEAINVSAFTLTESITTNEDSEELRSICQQLPLLSPMKEETTDSQPISSPLSSTRRFWHAMVCCPHELDVPLSDWKEIKALKTHEGIKRKMIKRVATSDLTFGHMPAPPIGVSGQVDSLGISEMLEYFTDGGVAADPETLSPIAVTTPSKPTRIHNAAMEDLTYQVISSFTPTSKKHYHGMDYCFSNTDLSKDSKLTKIQQRYLISERESHCSTISTPRVQRAMKKSRRNKEAMLQAKRAASMQVGVAQGDVTKRDFELEESTSFKQPHIPNSPMVAPTRHSTIDKNVRKPTTDKKLVIKLTRTKATSKGRTLATEKQLKTKGQRTDETEGSKVRMRLKSKDESVTSIEEFEGREVSTSVTTQVAESLGIQGKEGTGVEVMASCKRDKVSVTGEEATMDKRNPIRQTSVQVPMTSTSTILSSCSISLPRNLLPIQTKALNKTSSSAKRQEHHLKDLLGQAVVAALKRNGMPRSHQHFRACYTRLFNLSKMFMKEVKSSINSADALKKELKRVVALNVDTVITFQQRLNQKMALIQ